MTSQIATDLTIMDGGMGSELLKLPHADVRHREREPEDPRPSEEGTDAYIQGGIRVGDSEGWELSVYLENRSLAEVEISQENGKAEYTLSDDVNNTLGIKFTNNFQENMSLNINIDNDDVIP